jgi:hypothetical protein
MTMATIRTGLIVAGLLLTAPPLLATPVTTVEASQVGGFFADGGADNSAGFQNYFVGYGTSPGVPRTAERRSFFVFDLSGVSGTVTSASFSLILKDFGLIFGKDCSGMEPCTGELVDDPGTPGVDESDPATIPLDTFEEFVVGVTPLPSDVITDEFIPMEEAAMVFDTFDDAIVTDPVIFTSESPPPFEDGEFEVVLALNAAGIAVLNDAISTGTDEIILTGFMPTWSFEDRTFCDDPLGCPPGAPKLVESSELMFGLTDLVVDGVPTDLASPSLELTLAPIPVPPALPLFLSGLLGLSCWRRQRPR